MTDRWQNSGCPGIDGKGAGRNGPVRLGSVAACCGCRQAAAGRRHPNAANTHPETYPKFQKQLGRVAQLWEMINWCIRNPLEGEEMVADDPRMIAMQAYVYKERRGVKLDPGKH